MSDNEERIMSLEYRIQNIEIQIQKLNKMIGYLMSDLEGIEEKSDPSYSSWIGKRVCSDCLAEMKVKNVDYQITTGPSISSFADGGIWKTGTECEKCGAIVSKVYMIIAETQ